MERVQAIFSVPTRQPLAVAVAPPTSACWSLKLRPQSPVGCCSQTKQGQAIGKHFSPIITITKSAKRNWF